MKETNIKNEQNTVSNNNIYRNDDHGKSFYPLLL